MSAITFLICGTDNPVFVLINAFSVFSKYHQNINLIIIGTGEQKVSLNNLVKKLKLDNKIHLIGYKNNVFKYLYNAHGFILSSKWEDPGFVIIEAAACRTPIISSDCQNGPKELLDNGELFCETNIQDAELKNKVKEFFKSNFKLNINVSLVKKGEILNDGLVIQDKRVLN